MQWVYACKGFKRDNGNMGIMDFERNGFTLNWMDSFLLSWEGGGLKEKQHKDGK